jgi:UDP-N-acetylglucosamine 1-carboxyvinyltransferase
MNRIRIRGGKPLKGEIRISGAKNAALPLMAAALLTEQPLRLENLPDLADIRTMAQLLEQHGVTAAWNGKEGAGRAVRLTAATLSNTRAPYDLVRQMRASVLVLGPLVARAGMAEVSLPGGCAIGTRPIDLHLHGLERMGALIELADGYVRACAPGGLRGAEIVFPKVSVGATENLVMAATLARGETRLINAAREPEVADLCTCLIAMGAEIEGVGTAEITIRGVPRLSGAVHRVIPDRIECGTYLMAAAITGGEVTLLDGRAEHLDAVLEVARAAGISVEPAAGGLKVSCADRRLCGVDVVTEPYPGFPTDLQAQFMALMSRAREPLHACSRVGPHGCRGGCARGRGSGARRRGAEGCRGHGDGSAGQRIAGPGRPGGGRGDHHQQDLSPRSRLRAPRGEARPLRRGDRKTARRGHARRTRSRGRIGCPPRRGVIS